MCSGTRRKPRFVYLCLWVLYDGHMILLKLREYPETRGEDFPCSAFRWVFHASVNKHYASIGFAPQHKDKSDGKWYMNHTPTYELNITRHFDFGFDHFWYDGPHCSFSVGPLHFCWGGNPWTGRCKKCEAEAGIT